MIAKTVKVANRLAAFQLIVWWALATTCASSIVGELSPGDTPLAKSGCNQSIPAMYPMVGWGHKRVTQGHVGALADGCKHVFIDCGGNTGIQARKLFEPERYIMPTQRRASSLFSHWDNYFGLNASNWREDVCVFGWEPNPAHFARLRQIAQRYSSRGWRTSYILAAAGAQNDTLLFRAGVHNDIQAAARVVAECNPSLPSSDPHGRNHDFDKNATLSGSNVPVYDFVHFLQTHIAPRQRPSGAKGNVVTKVDVEGAEWAIFDKLMAIATQDPSIGLVVDEFVVEEHGVSGVSVSQIKARWDNTTVFNHKRLDDESFSKDPFPLLPRLGQEDSGVPDPWSTLTVKKDGAFWRIPGFQDQLHNLKPHDNRNPHANSTTNKYPSGDWGRTVFRSHTPTFESRHAHRHKNLRRRV